MKNLAIAAILAATVFSAQAATELVTNGDFESGSFSGWTKSGNTFLSDVISNTVTSNHTYLWRVGASAPPAYISQTLATVAGQTYTLSFDVNTPSISGSYFEAGFNGSVIYSFSNEVRDWTHVTVTGLVASSTATELKFGAYNTPNYTRLDNISVTAVPEPATYGMLLAGLGLLGAAARRRRRLSA